MQSTQQIRNPIEVIHLVDCQQPCRPHACLHLSQQRYVFPEPAWQPSVALIECVPEMLHCEGVGMSQQSPLHRASLPFSLGCVLIVAWTRPAPSEKFCHATRVPSDSLHLVMPSVRPQRLADQFQSGGIATFGEQARIECMAPRRHEGSKRFQALVKSSPPPVCKVRKLDLLHHTSQHWEPLASQFGDNGDEIVPQEGDDRLQRLYELREERQSP